MISQAESNKIYLLDFGLAEYSTNVESRGVDLHLIHRVLQSTHFKILEECFAAILEGYTQVLGKEKVNQVIQRLTEIEKRGRYH
jgi:TP53 regulating kinase-like protein